MLTGTRCALARYRNGVVAPGEPARLGIGAGELCGLIIGDNAVRIDSVDPSVVPV